jgi:hypothetical protein
MPYAQMVYSADGRASDNRDWLQDMVKRQVFEVACHPKEFESGVGGNHRTYSSPITADDVDWARCCFTTYDRW